MPWNRRFHRRVVYPVVVRLRGEKSLFSHLRELREIQYWPREALLRCQEKRLAEILNHAARSVRHYRDRWGKELPTVSREEAAAVLASLPYLTKRELQEHSPALVAAPSPRRVDSKTTGGSTGEPVTVLKDREATARERAASWLGYGWFGVKVGDRAARFWGSPATFGRRYLRFAAADLAMNRVRFSAFAFAEDDLERYWRRCLRIRPDYLYGYLSMIAEFAAHVRKCGHDGRRLALKSVITTAEALTEPERNLIAETFGTPVQDEYGCGEVGPIAYSCENGKLHVMTENVWLEVLGEDGHAVGRGEAGEVVVTDLNNRAMPLVRYRLGDFAVPGAECTCGRGFPVLERVWGRAYEFVLAPDGRRYHGEFFMYLFEDLREEGLETRKFRVTQRNESLLDIEVVVPEGLTDRLRESIVERLRQTLSGMSVSVTRVQSIPRRPSGKTEVIRNPWLRSHSVAGSANREGHPALGVASAPGLRAP